MTRGKKASAKVASPIDEDDDDDDDDDESEEKSAARGSKVNKQSTKASAKASKVDASNDDDDDDDEDDDDDDEDEDDDKPQSSKKTAASGKRARFVHVDVSSRTASSGGKASTASTSRYRKADITNRYDHQIRDVLDDADTYLDADSDIPRAGRAYDDILSTHSTSARAQYGRARVLDVRADRQQSNALLDAAIDAYAVVLDNGDTPVVLFQQAASRIIQRCRFRGAFQKAIKYHKIILDRLPADVQALNDYGITFNMISDYANAKRIFKTVLTRQPSNAVAHVHYGMALKLGDKNMAEAVKHLQKGVESHAEGTQDARFYFHLGDAMLRLGMVKKNPYLPKAGQQRKQA